MNVEVFFSNVPVNLTKCQAFKAVVRSRGIVVRLSTEITTATIKITFTKFML